MERVTHSPTLKTLQILTGVFLVQILAGFFHVGYGLFALSLPLSVAPWTIVVSVYAHAGIVHLVGNALALALFGLAVERITTPVRFHLYFLVSGALAGITQVTVSGLFGPSVSVIGASGAVFALLGYALTGNALAIGVLSRLSQRVQAGVFVLIAVVVTFLTAGPGVALLAHFTGLVIGLLAGRVRLLHTDENTDPTTATKL
ncbi:rhomboid family intramembrane serine protease [Halocatena salina]|uniref:Rhomboid family intramembrane serine protease n=1 Tax=Halocatena salina TaxID=2934340 RepID=A0A8U0A4I1_9EURY|nr:rhomboid family intramembrane serine protease [Halocatena salina]UPM44121.1 rhomboid family intramembrane serine protease [Halocatena salina]